MGVNGFIAEPNWEKTICPYCHAKLGMREAVARKRKRTYQCTKCHKITDERFVVR